MGETSMKLSRVLGSVGVVSAAALALVACGNKGESNNAGAKDAKNSQHPLRRKLLNKVVVYQLL